MKRIVARHWVFLGLFVVITAAMATGIRIPTPISPQTQKMYDWIDSLPAGSILLVSFDHEASSLPEIKPLGQALLRHCFDRGIRLVGVALMAEGTAVGYRLMQTTAGEYDREYGVDYVYLGFKPQYIAAILSLGESFEATFPEDYLGRPYGTLPLLEYVHNYDDVVGVLSIADGSFTTHWIEYGGRYDLTVAAGVTAAMITTYDPYLASGQLRAMIGGLRGAAEYERMIGVGAQGSRGMLAQTSAHIYVLIMVILGNVVYFMKRRRSS